ncbi:protein phosphatase 2C domain-containing protein [Hyphomicrobium sp. CS1BSMeth3]|uniref:protein phosphatase 2C domain-containing protein n=1 Tax=Hyphomicrobium sp. CS1BSMeth3 TaxID=1892844 RepID=UPI0009320597|nr:protein phosphatase 2C domain-containing protein [Hyphomicrobium sp. CS1BSMeth3]
MTMQPLHTCASYAHHGWRILASALTGQKHENNGQSCQDAFIVGGNGKAFWLAVADGMSKSSHGGEGAAVAVAALDQHMREATTHDLPRLNSAYLAAHTAITSAAARRGIDPTGFATTLVAAIVNEDQIHCASIGDSNITAISYSGDKIFGLCSPRLALPKPDPVTRIPKRRTYGINSPTWRKSTTFRSVPMETLAGFILHTDGANSVTEPDTKLYAPTLHQIGAKNDLRAVAGYFSIYSANIRDDDDATIVAALRPPS